MWSEFLMSTTLAGLVQIHMAENIFKKLTWTLVFLLLCVTTFWNTLPMVHDVMSYPIDVVVSDFESPDSGRFPYVALCTINQIDCVTLTRAYLQDRGELRDVMHLSYCAMVLGRSTSLLKEVCYSQ